MPDDPPAVIRALWEQMQDGVEPREGHGGIDIQEVTLL